LPLLCVCLPDIFRLNFSHGAHSEKDEVVKIIRRLEVKYRHTIGILADLQGPKLRIGKFHEGYAIVQTGQTFRLDLEVDTDGDETRVSLPHQEILQTLSVGDVVLLDDGKVRLVVTANDPGGLWVDTRVEVGGKLSDKKGVNLPTIIVPVSAMTVKDRADLQAALSMGVDWVALSFVQKPRYSAVIAIHSILPWERRLGMQIITGLTHS
jgi:pyruvate kinase